MQSICYEKPPEAVAEQFDTDLGSGLTKSEAKNRLRFFGKNIIYNAKTASGTGEAIAFLLDPSNLFFLLGTGIAAAEGRFIPLAFSLILWIVSVSLIAFLSASSWQVLSTVRTYSIPRIRVLRDGKVKAVDSRYIVPGDVILLSEGDIVPADCRVIYTNGMRVLEPDLNGDRIEEEKVSHAMPEALHRSEMKNMVFADSTVISGGGRAVVAATGRDTEALISRHGVPIPLKEKQTPEIFRRYGKKNVREGIIEFLLLFILSILYVFVGKTQYLDLYLAIVILSAASCEAKRILYTHSLSHALYKLATTSLGERAMIKSVGALGALIDTDVLCVSSGISVEREDIRVLLRGTDSLGIGLVFALLPNDYTDFEKISHVHICRDIEECVSRVYKDRKGAYACLCRNGEERTRLINELKGKVGKVSSLGALGADIPLLAASDASFTFGLMKYGTSKMEDITLDDIDGGVGNQAVIRMSDVVCEPSAAAVIRTLTVAKDIYIAQNNTSAFLLATRLIKLFLFLFTFFSLPSLTPYMAVFCGFGTEMLSGYLISRESFSRSVRQKERGKALPYVILASYAVIYLVVFFAAGLYKDWQFQMPLVSFSSLVVLEMLTAGMLFVGSKIKKAVFFMIPLIILPLLALLSVFKEIFVYSGGYTAVLIGAIIGVIAAIAAFINSMLIPVGKDK